MLTFPGALVCDKEVQIIAALPPKVARASAVSTFTNGESCRKKVKHSLTRKWHIAGSVARCTLPLCVKPWVWNLEPEEGLGVRSKPNTHTGARPHHQKTLLLSEKVQTVHPGRTRQYVDVGRDVEGAETRSLLKWFHWAILSSERG